MVATWPEGRLGHVVCCSELGGAGQHIEYAYVDTGQIYLADITEAKANVPLDDTIFAMPTP